MYLVNERIFANHYLNLFQVKILNSATNRTNYTVTIITENLDCDNKEMLIYGEQNIPNMDKIYPSERFLRLDSSSVNNGQNECVFRHICEHICYYVHWRI